MMDENQNQLQPDCTSITLSIKINESCIDNLLTDLQMDIPVNEQYTLINLKLNFSTGKLNFSADVKEKPGTSVDLTSSPEWDEAAQRLVLKNLDLKTDSNNLLLKGAGWFAQTFLQGKIDRKMEEQANQMFRNQIQKLKEKPFLLPGPRGSSADVKISEILVHSLAFTAGTVEVIATIMGSWRLQMAIA